MSYESCLPVIYGHSWAITREGLESLMAQAAEVDWAKALVSKSGEAMRQTEQVRVRGM